MPKTVALDEVSFSKQVVQDARGHGTLDPALFAIAVDALNTAESCREHEMYIVPVKITSRMSKAKVTDVTSLTPPKNHGSKAWIPEVDIFQKKQIVLPFSFITPGKKRREFHIVVINMGDGTITVLSPIHEQNMHHRLVDVRPQFRS